MSPLPSVLLRVTPWIIFSDPLGNVVKFCSNCTISSHLPLSVLVLIIVSRVRIINQNFLRYVTFDTLENKILITFP